VSALSPYASLFYNALCEDDRTNPSLTHRDKLRLLFENRVDAEYVEEIERRLDPQPEETVEQ